jgi:cyclohexanone monooxygenase
MSTSTSNHPAAAANPGKTTRYDAVIIGAGFSGLYMLHKLRDEQGLSVRVIDAAGGVGGTWYWNRYPGARSDSESFVYCYSFSKELREEWEWSDRYPRQPEILKYLNHVADRFDLRRDIQLNTRVESAHYQESQGRWDIQTDQGEKISAQFLITGLGLFTTSYVPEIKGLSSFAGKTYHTGAWPHEPVDFTGKRVGVIGTGSTGVQVIAEIAPQVGHLTVFQRTPQYSVPARHGPMPKDFIASVKANYDQIWRDVRDSSVAFGFPESKISAFSVSDEQRNAIYEEAWRKGGGFRFMFETFNDIVTDRRANETAAEFIRNKIRSIVKDQVTAEKLVPYDLYAKRPLCDPGYFEVYNRDNVDLVDIRRSPIREITPTGVRTADGEYPLDILIFATGFDTVTGVFSKIDIRGKGGLSLKEKWAEGPTSAMGVATAGFPNMFMITGPCGPFTNLPPTIEVQVEWVADFIKHIRSKGIATVELEAEAENSWTEVCRMIAGYTLFPLVDSWIMGSNIPGKPRSVMFYMAGLGAYRQHANEVATNDYKGFVKRQAAQQVSA